MENREDFGTFSGVDAEEVDALVNKIGEALHGASADLGLWALTIMAAKLISFSSSGLGQQRMLIAGFVHNMHNFLPNTVEISGETMFAGGGPNPSDEDVKITEAITTTVMTVLWGMAGHFGPTPAVSAFVTAIANMFASGNDELVEFGQRVLREVAESLPKTHAQFAAATAFDELVNTGDVGHA